MDLVQILLLCVVGFSVLVFLLFNAVNSVQDDGENSDDVEQKRSLLCDFDRITTTGSCGAEYAEGSDDQEKEKGGGTDHDGEKVAVSGIFERMSSEKIEEPAEAESCGISSSENPNIRSALLGISGNDRGEILGCEMDINEEDGDFEDWEGVERTELEKTFGKAVVFLSSKSNADRLSGDVKLQLHGLQRIALEGVCCGSQPMALKVSARAKWNVWRKLSDMSRETAMENYINMLSEYLPEWKGEDLSNF
ncbi:acyl-CoA-binding domain-containing protein 3-like [Dorcoceras hygrometricum]|uniref:Acyl-CoA-binding domain-containing protein 3-like n=1 Tax=Dorcoceras hygrometricum TaxID=472368 RepID=A0A2Z7DH70_9LAMI|nr:acyl-CoA-binding domain-containing protein 3-like [Dorcoceras hygrometricum]